MKTTDEKVEGILRDADESCEGANYHNLYGLAEKVYSGVKNLVPEQDRVKAAKAIQKAIESIL